MRFLDIILGQVFTARTRLNVPLPVTFMNSFRTSDDTMKALRHQRKFKQTDIPLEIIQHQEPNRRGHRSAGILAGQPRSGWCPPGHGDLFSTLWESGLLDTLLEHGFEYLFISNSDNLGARPSRTLAQYFEDTGAPFMVEVANRTYADRKGGHIVRDTATGRLILREMSQVHPDDKDAARTSPSTRISTRTTSGCASTCCATCSPSMTACCRFPSSSTTRPSTRPTPVPGGGQLETAMGAAIGLFEGAICVQVDACGSCQ